MSTDTATSEAANRQTPTGPSLRRWLVAGLAFVAVLSVGALSWVWRHPDQSFQGGYGLEVQRQLGQPVWTTLVHSGRPGPEQVTITSLEPRFETDGTEATVEYLICELDPDVLSSRGVGGFGYGMHAQDVARYCTRTRPAEGATFPLRSQPPQEVLVGITPTRPGRTVISSHRMSFSVGWQRGSNDIGVEVKLVGRPRVD